MPLEPSPEDKINRNEDRAKQEKDERGIFLSSTKLAYSACNYRWDTDWHISDHCSYYLCTVEYAKLLVDQFFSQHAEEYDKQGQMEDLGEIKKYKKKTLNS